MNARSFVLLGLIACRTEPVVAIPALEQQCKAPRFDASSTCENVLASFYGDMADACEGQPALAEAMRAVSLDVTLRTPPVGSAFWRARDRKSFTLFQASWALLPSECTTDFNAKNYPVDDYGRGVDEVSHLWQSERRCRPGDSLGDALGTIDVGVWSFATVLAPHLDAAGKAYLAKLLACEEH